MGAIADAVAAFAKPLLDETDGSPEQVSRALMITQLCWNLALLPEDEQGQKISEMQRVLEMEDDAYDAFRRSVVVPMIQRHKEMFPQLHRRIAAARLPSDPSLPAPPRGAAREKYPGTNPYAPCPCNSGRKYKFCCRSGDR